MTISRTQPKPLDIRALKADEPTAFAKGASVNTLGTLSKEAKTIDSFGDGNGRVTMDEVLAYFGSLEKKGRSVPDASKVIAEMKVVNRVGTQIAAAPYAGTIADAIDTKVKVGQKGARIGDGNHQLSRGEVDRFLAEMHRRPDTADNRQYIAWGEALRDRFFAA